MQNHWPLGGDQYYFSGTLSADAAYVSLPFWLSILSAAVSLIQIARHQNCRLCVKEFSPDDRGPSEDRRGSTHNIITRNGGATVFTFMVARLSGSASLVALSVLSLSRSTPHPSSDGAVNSSTGWSVLAANVYAFTVALAAILTACPFWRMSLIRQNISILFAELGVYAYRDLWPLATYDNEPLDITEGGLMWARLGLLVVTAVIIPLLIPNIYIPVDPKRAEPIPHPEQTASLLSFHTYSYLNPVVNAANKVAHFPASDLPPMADYDRAQDLLAHASRYLDGVKVRTGGHIFFRILHCFGWRYFRAFIGHTLYTLCMFASPLAVNRLLSVLGSDAEDSSGIRPWFWILCMFTMPLLGCISYQYYIIVMTRTLANAQSIVTHILFDYSLKVRIKAETSDAERAAADSPVGVESRGGNRAKGGRDAKRGKEANSFIGRLTNLVTIDLTNITTARDLVPLVWTTPVKIAISAFFLYELLGWSSFVGLGLMVALLPVPGWLTSIAQGVQKEKMKKVLCDAPLF
ncbi:hypothetical protein NMY22_g16136 [Coprinellus aureogranulatus]|nr:hypothetical protein NMY22_g16136 [Coprinellus aureogranulatus]